MAGDDVDELEAALDPTARLFVSHLRRENAELREQLAKNGELIQRLTEQVEALNRRLFGKRSEKIPSVREELRQRVDPDEQTVDGKPMPERPEARAKERRRKARRASEPERKSRLCACHIVDGIQRQVLDEHRTGVQEARQGMAISPRSTAAPA